MSGGEDAVREIDWRSPSRRRVDAWRGRTRSRTGEPLDPANTLVIETSKGRIVVEMAPLLAPKAVERVKRLAREGVYDGLKFHRVIAGFVDQTGNPNNHDGGTSSLSGPARGVQRAGGTGRIR